jgi:hypothetical protein
MECLMNPFTTTLEPVWQAPTCVWINSDAVATTSEKIASEGFPTPSWREEVFPSDDLVFLDFVGIGNAINFAFTDFETHQSFSVQYRGTLWRGAFAMWACLQRASDRGMDLFCGERLREISVQDVGEIFAGESAIPMLQERWAILREVGTILSERYGGRFRNVFLEGEARAFGNDGLVDRLVRSFPSFRDESVHRSSGAVLKFQKRAQLMAMMYQGRALTTGSLRQLSDFAEVGPIADYSVPRALHSAGILEYAPELEAQIRARQVIEKDGVAEQEIRAQTVRAQILLLTAINRLRASPITFINLDYKLWTMGRGAKEPHHLTITTAY